MDGRALELWERIAARIRELSTLLANADDEAWALRCPGEEWTVGLVACHVSLGLRRQARWVELVLAGRAPRSFDWERTHALNALVARRVVTIESGDVLHAIDTATERWRGVLERVTDRDLERPALRYDTKLLTVEWIAGTIVPRHIDGHLRSIRATLGHG